jgi:hypothetical protein
MSKRLPQLVYLGLEGRKMNSHLILTGAETGLVHRFCHRRFKG